MKVIQFYEWVSTTGNKREEYGDVLSFPVVLFSWVTVAHWSSCTLKIPELLNI